MSRGLNLREDLYQVNKKMRSEPPFSYSRDVAPLKGLHFNPADDSSIESYSRQFAPLIAARNQEREDRRRRKREDFLFKQQKNKFRQEKENQKLARQARQDDPRLSQELANITEMDDPKAAMAELVSWTALNSKALRENPSLSNTQVMISNILTSKAEEESSNEMLLAKQIESFIAAGDFETAASMTQEIKNPTILDTLNRNIATARKSITTAEANAITKTNELIANQAKAQKEDWEEASKSFEPSKDFPRYDPETNKPIKFDDLSPLKKLEVQGKPKWAVVNIINAARIADRRLFAEFLNEDVESLLDDEDKGNQLLKLTDQYYRFAGTGSSRGAAPTVNAGE